MLTSLIIAFWPPISTICSAVLLARKLQPQPAYVLRRGRGVNEKSGGGEPSDRGRELRGRRRYREEVSRRGLKRVQGVLQSFALFHYTFRYRDDYRHPTTPHILTTILWTLLLQSRGTDQERSYRQIPRYLCAVRRQVMTTDVDLPSLPPKPQLGLFKELLKSMKP